MPAAKKPASGMYKAKARNLTDTQLKRAGGAKAATKRTVDIGSTSRVTTGGLKGKTVGPGGKPLTGTVIMPNGDRAVYKGGKRVTNAPKATAKPTNRSTKTVNNKTITPSPPPSDKKEETKTLTGNKRTNRLSGARYEAMKGMTRNSTNTPTQTKSGGINPKSGTYRPTTAAEQRKKLSEIANRWGTPPSSNVRKLDPKATPKGNRPGEFAKIGSGYYVWAGTSGWIRTKPPKK